MTSYSSTITMAPPAHRSASGHAKLHKRGSSGSSLPAAPSPLSSSYFTPYTTTEEPFPALASTPPLPSAPRIRASMRKTSASKNADQGRIDLSKSLADNDRVTGLGINDGRSVSDVPFAHVARRGTHARTTSVSSNMSSASGRQPFVHPMRQTPRPHTPLTISSNTSFADAEEATDVLDDEFTLGAGYRSKRSISISSGAPGVPTPLSQSHTVDDLGMVPKLTSTSQTNLSIRSGKSGKSGKSKLGRSRGDTGHSFDQHPPSSRNSFDKAFSFVSRKSDPEGSTRDQRIYEARRKFEEKEANKDRKLEHERVKRQETNERKQERQRRKSEASERARPVRAPPKAKLPDETRTSPIKGKKQAQGEEQEGDDKLRARSYEDHEPAHQMTMPRRGVEAGQSEKPTQQQRRKSPQSGWVRFSAWLQTRMLGCGGR